MEGEGRRCSDVRWTESVGGWKEGDLAWHSVVGWRGGAAKYGAASESARARVRARELKAIGSDRSGSRSWAR